MCDPEAIGAPSIFSVIRRAAALANTRPVFAVSCGHGWFFHVMIHVKERLPFSLYYDRNFFLGKEARGARLRRV